jgi:hypothetical protein
MAGAGQRRRAVLIGAAAAFAALAAACVAQPGPLQQPAATDSAFQGNITACSCRSWRWRAKL